MQKFMSILAKNPPHARLRLKLGEASRVVRWTVLTALAWAGLAGQGRAAPDFQKDIAPLLRQYCAGCHNDEDFEGDYSVERYADLVEGGSKGSLLKPGNAEESRLIKMMGGRMKPYMPPKDDPQPTEEEKEVLKNWLAAGAKGPEGEHDVSILSTMTVPKIAAATGGKPVTAMETSADGKRLALARFRQVDIVNTDDVEKMLVRLSDLSGKVNAVHFTPDGKRLVSASGIAGLKGIATLWDLDTGKAVAGFGEGYHRDVLYDAELSPDGKILATAGYDTKIGLWEVESGRRLHSIAGHNGAVYDLAFSPDGTVLASASGDQTVKLWRVDSGQRLDTLNQPQGEQFSVVFTRDGKYILAAGADKRIRMWRFISRDKARINPLLHSRFAHEGNVVKIVLSADGGRLVSSGDDLSVKAWSLPGLVQLKAWGNQADVASALAMTKQGFVAATMDGGVGQFSWKGLKVEPSKAEVGKAMPTKVDSTVGKKDKTLVSLEEREGVDLPLVLPPLEFKGVIAEEGDEDEIRFSAKAGESWVIEVDAARSKSPLDSKIIILDAKGKPVERIRLQAVRDSWFTFRGKNSDTPDDFRIHNWREMELNEYLYANGEVVKLWLYPRGPDSGFKVYPGFGKRHGYFGTTPLAHALGEPCYIVRPIPAGVDPAPNGLPVYTIYFENDDDPERRLGVDSKLIFTAPYNGDYRARITDVRGFGGKEFGYVMKVRPLKQDFKVSIGQAKELAVSPGSGREFEVTAERSDGFDGEIRVDIGDLPQGFSAGTPVVIQQGQHKAAMVVNAAADAEPVEKARIKITATAQIGGREVKKAVAAPENVKLGKAAKLLLRIEPDGKSGDPKVDAGKLVELTIHPGETITGFVVADRQNFDESIQFGKDESGRNLAHGLIIDNIGLNGLMIPEGKDRQRFFITAAEWVPESTRHFHLRTAEAGGHATPPIVLRVVARDKKGKLAER
jgi:WD40 repeat protein